MLRILAAMTLTVGLALSSASLSSPAAAQSFSPTSTTAVFTGYLELTPPAPGVPCLATVTLSIDSAGAAAVLGQSFSPGHGVCGVVFTPFGTWSVAPWYYSPTASLIEMYIGFTGLPGQACHGRVIATLQTWAPPGTASLISIAPTWIDPATPTSLACTVEGEFRSSTPLAVVP